MYGAFIRAVRQSRGLSQGELAAIVGINQPNLSAYENDRQMPSADILNKLLVGCGYVLQAVAGARTITCPLPRTGWFPDEGYWPDRQDDSAGSMSSTGNPTAGTDPEERAVYIERVLAMSDTMREAKTLR